MLEFHSNPPVATAGTPASSMLSLLNLNSLAAGSSSFVFIMTWIVKTSYLEQKTFSLFPFQIKTTFSISSWNVELSPFHFYDLTKYQWEVVITPKIMLGGGMSMDFIFYLTSL